MKLSSIQIYKIITSAVGEMNKAAGDLGDGLIDKTKAAEKTVSMAKEMIEKLEK